MMSRTQITLEPELQQQARAKARQLGISMAEYIRRLVARDLAATIPSAPPEQVFNLGDSGGSDIAHDKDDMIGAAATAERSRSGRGA